MRSSASVVRESRLVFEAAVRLIGLIVLVIAIVGPLASWLVEGIHDGDLTNYIYYAARINITIFLVVCGLLFMIFANIVSRWLIRIQEPECPKCRFSLEHFRADRCPECGLFLGEDFHAPHPSAPDTDSRVITTESTPE